MSSGFFSFNKPWKEALLLGLVLLPLFGLGLIVGPLYYFLNKRLTVGVREQGLFRLSLVFKRSVIEGQRIDESEARKVIEVIRELLDGITETSKSSPRKELAA